jgi:predicted transposase YdaD
MQKIWDDKIKRLFATLPHDLVAWLLPGAVFIEKVSLELKTLTRTINPDTLFKVFVNGEMALLHIEIQKRHDANMAKRVWEYTMLATLAYDCPVYSFVIYLKPNGRDKIPDPPMTVGLPKRGNVHIFYFTNIKLWELSVDALKGTGLKGILPLCLLAGDGMRREVGEQVFEQVKDNKELLTLALTLASMVFMSEADQQWLERKVAMFEDIARDTWFVQKYLNEGREQGREEGTLEALRLVIQNTVREHFPELIDLAKQQTDGIQNSTILLRLTSKIVDAQTVEDARRHLLEARSNG